MKTHAPIGGRSTGGGRRGMQQEEGRTTSRRHNCICPEVALAAYPELFLPAAIPRLLEKAEDQNLRTKHRELHDSSETTSTDPTTRLRRRRSRQKKYNTSIQQTFLPGMNINSFEKNPGDPESEKEEKTMKTKKARLSKSPSSSSELSISTSLL